LLYIDAYKINVSIQSEDKTASLIASPPRVIRNGTVAVNRTTPLPPQPTRLEIVKPVAQPPLDHHACLAAMRLAFESMLSQFDPQHLEEEFDRQMKGSTPGVPAKLRYWDLYRDKYGDLIKDAEAGFRTLFGDAFARAYEEHMQRLKQSGRPVGQ
jgi:hypothetical protein